MSFAEIRRPMLPYAVMLAVALTSLVWPLINGIHVLHTLQARNLGQDQLQLQEFFMIIPAVERLIVVAAVSLGTACWWIESRRAGGLAWFAPLLAAALSTVLLVAHAFGSTWLFASLVTRWSHGARAGLMEFQAFYSLSSFFVVSALVAGAVWVALQMSGELGGMTEEPPAPASRALAVTVFMLAVWAWTAPVVAFALPSLLLYLLPQGWINMNPLIGLPMAALGSFGFVLPALVGGLFGLPKQLAAVRPWRLWGVATLCFLPGLVLLVVAAAVPVAFLVFTSYGRVSLSEADKLLWGLGLIAVATTLWFGLTALLSWLLVRGMTRSLAVVEAG